MTGQRAACPPMCGRVAAHCCSGGCVSRKSVTAPKAFGVEVVVFLALLVPAFFAPTATAGERSVNAAQANGTYRDVEGKSEIKILALGHGKLKVQLALVYEFKSGAGPMANLGDASGEATIENDVAVFVPEEAGDCKITMTFLPNGKLKVEQQGEECGFGHNVRADGTFRKISNRKPKFDDA